LFGNPIQVLEPFTLPFKLLRYYLEPITLERLK